MPAEVWQADFHVNAVKRMVDVVEGAARGRLCRAAAAADGVPFLAAMPAAAKRVRELLSPDAKPVPRLRIGVAERARRQSRRFRNADTDSPLRHPQRRMRNIFRLGEQALAISPSVKRNAEMIKTNPGALPPAGSLSAAAADLESGKQPADRTALRAAFIPGGMGPGLPRKPNAGAATTRPTVPSTVSRPPRQMIRASIAGRPDGAPQPGANAKRDAGPRTAMDALVSAYDGRNLSRFHVQGGVLSAAKALAKANHVMVLTGFSVAAGKPETDGPPGAAALGHALQELGKTVTFVTDRDNAPIMKAAMKPIDAESAQYSRFITFDAAHGDEATHKANELLDLHRPDAVVAVELPGRSEDGSRRNMRGVAVDFNGPVDSIVLAANDRPEITTVGVGDGGNEAGMGGLSGLPRGLDGSNIASVVPVNHPVTAWASNVGAEAIAATMLASADKLDKLHTPEQQGASVRATLKAGAVDGVTRKHHVGELSDDKLTTTGVDGFSLQVHAGTLEMLKNVARIAAPGFQASATPKDGKPFVIAAFDSSNGGLVAAKNLAGFLKYRSPHEDARFLIVADHGNAPYGEKTRDTLVTLVGRGLKVADKAGADVIAMACNTACTAFPEAREGLKAPVVDLISETSSAIVEHGGKKPVAFSTPATAKDPMYPDKVNDASDGKVAMTMIGCQEWAPLVNDLKHVQGASKNDQAAVADAVAKYVKQIPKDATSVWLCCTHYPALKPQIESAMKKHGRGYIPVVDPMEYQADAIIKTMAGRVPGAGAPNRSTDKTPIVVTSGTAADRVEASAKDLLGTNPIVVYSRAGKSFNVELVDEHLNDGPDDAGKTTNPETRP
jgi:glutamate racemase